MLNPELCKFFLRKEYEGKKFKLTFDKKERQDHIENCKKWKNKRDIFIACVKPRDSCFKYRNFLGRPPKEALTNVIPFDFECSEELFQKLENAYSYRNQ
jgi:hypothetical protein